MGLILVVVGIVATAAVLGGILYYEYEPGNALNPYHVRVTEIIWYWESNETLLTTQAGFSLHAGGSAWLGAQLWCADFFSVSETCQSGNIDVVTQGFSLMYTNTPFSWSSGASGSYAVVHVEVGLPASTYNGQLEVGIVS